MYFAFRQGSFRSYDYIWFPDDDVYLYGENNPERLFSAAADSNADMFQPAIGNILVNPSDLDKYYSPKWEPTLLIQNAKYHVVNVVEIMAHGFTNEAFTKALLFQINLLGFSHTGWGIESVLADSVNGKTVVLDSVPIIHSRPVSFNSKLHLAGQHESRFMSLRPMQTTKIVY